MISDLNLSDMETGMKAFRPDKLMTLQLRAHRFTFEPEITCRAARARSIIYEVPFAEDLALLSTIPGVKHDNAAVIIAEIGTDMSRFPSDGHVASWSGIAPGSNESAGKRRRTKARKGNRWLRAALVESGHAAGRSRNTALAAIYRRMIIRGGRKYAAFVVGHHILIIAYHLLAKRTTYRELGLAYFEQRRAEQLKRRCLDQLRTLGFQATLTPLHNAARGAILSMRSFSQQEDGTT